MSGWMGAGHGVRRVLQFPERIAMQSSPLEMLRPASVMFSPLSMSIPSPLGHVRGDSICRPVTMTSEDRRRSVVQSELSKSSNPSSTEGEGGIGLSWLKCGVPNKELLTNATRVNNSQVLDAAFADASTDTFPWLWDP